MNERLGVDNRRYLRLPITLSMIYMWFGLVWFLIGPIFEIEWNYSLLRVLIFVSACFVCFSLGYRMRLQMLAGEELTYGPKEKVLAFLRVMIYVNLVFTALNAYQYSYTTSLSQLLNKAMTALSDPGDAYFDKILTMQEVSTSYSVLTYITVFMAPLLFPTLIMSLYYYKELNLLQKVTVVATLILEAMRWLAVGTNKGLLDIAVLFATVMLIRYMRASILGREDASFQKKKKNFAIIAIGVIVAFVVVFGYFLTSRSDVDVNTPGFARFPNYLFPMSLRPAVLKISSYLCQGYRSLQHIFDNLNWIPTWGVGNSTFLISVVKRLTGVDLFLDTYQHRIIATGLVHRGAFQTVFAYLANDLTFPGTVIFMYFVGRFFCSIVKEAVLEEDPISITLLYMMVLAVLNVSCLNYMLSFSNMCVGFWGLFIVRAITKKLHIRIVFKRQRV